MPFMVYAKQDEKIGWV